MEIMLGREWPPTEVIPSGAAADYMAEMRQAVSPLVLLPFLDAYAVVAALLGERGDESGVDEAKLVERCLVVGRQWALQRRIGMESVTGEMFRTALRLAEHRELLTAGDPDLHARRTSFVSEIDEYRARIKQVAEATDPRRLESDDGQHPLTENTARGLVNDRLHH
jgi:glycerol-3-phosphate O-acyltransferase